LTALNIIESLSTYRHALNTEFCLTRHSRLLSIHGYRPTGFGLAPLRYYQTLLASPPRPADSKWQLLLTINKWNKMEIREN